MICRPLILAITALAVSAAQDYPNTGNIFVAPVKSIVLNFNPVECNCRGPNPGTPNILCGDDGKNYYNFEKLNCINKCMGTNVQIAHYGQCRKGSDFAQLKITTDSESLPSPAIPAVPVPPVAPLVEAPSVAIPPMPVAPTTAPPMPAAPTMVPTVSAPGAPFPPPVGSGCPCMKNIGRDEPAPFCGDDGYTYNSESEASCIGFCYGKYIKKIHDGPCVTNENCNCQPSSVSDPICGTDGNTYMNRQVLDCHNYCKKQRVQQLFKGKCGGVATYSTNILSSLAIK